MQPSVLILVVNWNKRDYVIRLLESLNDIHYNNYKILVVDNASSDGSVQSIKEAFPNADIIVNATNLGSTGGFNTGLKYAAEKEYKYTWLLDNDAAVEKETLREMVDVMEHNDDVGICGCTIYEYEKKDFLVECGSFISTKAQLNGFCGKQFKLPDEPYEVDFVVSCSALVHTKAAEEVNFMDERYFLFWDDVDFCIKLKTNGYKVVSVPNARAYHKAFLPGDRPLNYYYEFRNRFLFISKHLGLLQKVISLCVWSRVMTKIFIYSYFQGRHEEWSRLKHAFIDFIQNRWGGRSFVNSTTDDEGITFSRLMEEHCIRKIKVLVLPAGSAHAINEALTTLAKVKNHTGHDVEVHLFIQRSRLPLIDYGLADKVIIESLFDNSRLPTLMKMLFYLFKITIGRYDMAIDTADREISLYYYALPKIYRWNPKAKLFYLSTENTFRAWKLPLSFLLAEITTPLIFPFLFVKSFRYGSDKATKKPLKLIGSSQKAIKILSSLKVSFSHKRSRKVNGITLF